MKLTIEEVKNTAKLAKLKLNQKESVEIACKINEVLSEFKNISWTGDIDFNSENIGNSGNNIGDLRQDKVHPYKQNKQLLLNTKNMRENYIVLPKIIE